MTDAVGRVGSSNERDQLVKQDRVQIGKRKAVDGEQTIREGVNDYTESIASSSKLDTALYKDLPPSEGI